MQQKLHEYLLSEGIFPQFEITLIKKGYNHDIFLIEILNEKYIAHLGRGNRDSGSDLNNAYTALKFLDLQNVDFVPKAVLFDKEKDILVQTYVGQTDVIFEELTEKQLDAFMNHLAVVHGFTQMDVQQFCIENKIEGLQVHTPSEGLRIFGEKRFVVVQKLCPDSKIVEWIQPKIMKNIALAKTLTDNCVAGLRMGDIGGNIRGSGDNLFLIDWEFASLGYEHELAYIKIHSHPTNIQFTYMVDRYSHYSGIKTTELYDEVIINEQIIRVNDVIWAAMKWGQNIGNQTEEEKYKKLTYKRMELYEGMEK